MFFSLRYDSKIKPYCFVDFLVFSLSLSLSNWAIFSSLKLLNLLAAIFALTKNNTISSPVVFGQRFNNLQRAALLTSLIQYDEVSFQIWWTAAGYGELCVWFQPIRNGEIFWMNNIYIYIYIYIYILFYPIFRKVLPFFIRVLQTVAFGNYLNCNVTVINIYIYIYIYI